MDFGSLFGYFALAVKYGPDAVQAIQKLLPLIKAVTALVGSHVDNGADMDTAVAKTTEKIRSLHKMTPAEEQAWFDRASNPYAGGA